MKLYVRVGHLMTAGISVLTCMATILLGGGIARGQAADSAGPNIMEIRERYIEEPASGLYPPGKFGGSLFLCNRQPLVYPLFFRDTDVSEGAVSVWFKPMRKHGWDSQIPLAIAGMASLRFSSSGKNNDVWRFNYPNGGMKIDDAFCDTFHHLIYTWNRDVEETWLDGRLVAQKQRPKDSAHARAGLDARLQMSSFTGQLMDELIVLDRYLPETAALALYKTKTPWQIDASTVLYAPFDDTTMARGAAGAGDVVRMHVHVGRIDATFLEGEPAAFLARIFNATPRDKSLTVKYTVHDIQRAVVAEGSLPVRALARTVTDLPMPLHDVKDMGLFWTKLELYDGATVIGAETIPMGRSLAVRGRDLDPADMATGFDIGYGLNAPAYQKWVRIDLNGIYDAPGVFYFERLNHRVDSLRKAGCVPVAHVYPPPVWFREKYKNRYGLHGYYLPDAENAAAMQLWAEFVRGVAEQCKGRVHHYNFFPEYYGRCEPEAYARLFNLTAALLKQVDPDIQIASTIGGYYSWYNTVVPLIAERADYWTFHPYQFVNGADPRQLWDERWIGDTYLKTLKKYGARTRFANTEYGCWHALSHAVDADGYPLTKDEFNTKMAGGTPEFVAKRGLAAFVDLYTAAFRAVRGHVISMAAGCEYALWWSSAGGGMIADLHFARHTPSTLSLAYANMSGLLAGHRYVKRIDLGADGLHGYLFEQDKTYTLVAFSDYGNGIVFPEVAGEHMAALDLYGNPAVFARAGGAIKLQLNENIPLYITGITSLPESTAPVLKAECVDEYLYPGVRGAIRVSVYNPLAQKINAAIAVKLPESFGTPPLAADVALASGERKQLVFEIVPPLSANARQTGEITMRTDSPELGAFGNPIYLPVRTSVIARRLAAPLALDGDLTQWGDPANFPICLDDGEQVVRGVPHTKMYLRDQQVDWHGRADLSARAAVAYDAQYLYIAFRVWDDKVMNLTRYSPIYIYEGDGVEIFIDGRGPETMGAVNYFGEAYHIKLAPGMTPEATSFHHVSKPQLGMQIDGLAHASKLLDDGYALEIKIPWTAFPALRPEPGLRMGLAFHLNDQDEKRFPSNASDEHGKDPGAGSKVTMLWGGEPGVSSDPSKLGILILGENP